MRKIETIRRWYREYFGIRRQSFFVHEEETVHLYAAIKNLKDGSVRIHPALETKEQIIRHGNSRGVPEQMAHRGVCVRRNFRSFGCPGRQRP